MKRLITSVFALFLTVSVLGQVPEKPHPPRLLNDYSGLLSPEEQQVLEYKLDTFSRSTTTQIVIVIVDDLGGYEPSQFAYELGEKWGVGKKGFNNGVVILVKPTGGAGEKKTFIATGYGLEAVIPDAIAKRIVEQEMIPMFKQNRFFDGLNSATDVIMSLAAKEFTPQEYVDATPAPKRSPGYFFLVVIVIWLIIRMFSVRSYASTNRIPFWTALWLLSSTSRSHGGGFGNFSSGGGSFGGFGGFGGGSFGGGGAGGSW